MPGVDPGGGARRTTWWVVLAAVFAASVVVTVSARPILAEEGLLGNFVFLAGCAAGLAIPGFVVIRWLGRGFVESRVLLLGVLMGFGPVTAAVVVPASGYLPATPASSVGELVLRSAVVPPIVEELCKAAASALLLAVFVDRMRLARRHGALMGAAVGMGFVVSEAAWYATLAVAGDTVIDSWGQLVSRFVLLGLSGHTLMAALAGVGVVELLALPGARGTASARTRRAAPWLIAAVVIHALHNSVGAWLLSVVVQGLAAAPLADATPIPLAVAWTAALVSTVVVQGWAWIALARHGLDARPIAGRPLAEPDGAAAGTGMQT